MKRYRYTNLLMSFIFASVLFLSVYNPLSIFANDTTILNSNRTFIFMLDINALNKNSDQSINILTSLLNVASTLSPDDEFYFTSIDKISNGKDYHGPYKVDSTSKTMSAELADIINAHIYSNDIGLEVNDSMLQAYNFLESINANSGSGIFIIGGSPVPILMSEADSENVKREFIDPIAKLYAANSWKIYGFNLPDSPQSMVNLVERYAQMSNGFSSSFISPFVLKDFSDSIMLDKFSGSLQFIQSTQLKPADTLLQKIEVSPGTKNITLLFFKEDIHGSLRLINPYGIESYVGDRTSSTVTESPHSIIWEITDPMPGKWSVEINNINGEISAWGMTKNKYEINLLNSQNQVSQGDSLILVSYVTDNTKSVIILKESVNIQLSLINPEGTATIYEMNDLGVNGDAIENDGYFSIAIPQITMPGFYKVKLQMKWDGYDKFSLIANNEFESIAFPRLIIDALNATDINTNSSSNIATLYVKINENPYAINPESISSSIYSNNGVSDSNMVKIIPRRSNSDGKAWMFDVIFTPKEIGEYSIDFGINLEYASTYYDLPTQSILVNSISKTTLNITLFAIILIAVVFAGFSIIIAGGYLYRRNKTHPFGYLIDENGNQLVDFSNIKKSLVQSVINRDSINGKELNIKELSEVIFKFKAEVIYMKTHNIQSTVRINSSPIINGSVIDNNTWIGTSGKLFQFISKSSTE